MNLGLIAMMAPLLGGPGDASSFSQKAKDGATAATVRIDNPARSGKGTGAIVGRGGPFLYILTAAHVIKDGTRLEVTTFSAEGKTLQIYRSTEVVAVIEGIQDLALLRIATKDEPRAMLRVCPVKELPTRTALPALTVGCPDGDPPSCLVERIAGPKKVRRPGAAEPGLFWEVESKYPGGRSGGPVVDARGYLVGVCSGTGGDKTYFTHVTEVHQFLQRHGFRWLFQDAPANASKE